MDIDYRVVLESRLGVAYVRNWAHTEAKGEYVMDEVPRRPAWNKLVDHIYGLGIKLNSCSPAAKAILQACRYQLMQVPKKHKILQPIQPQ